MYSQVFFIVLRLKFLFAQNWGKCEPNIGRFVFLKIFFISFFRFFEWKQTKMNDLKLF